MARPFTLPASTSAAGARGGDRCASVMATPPSAIPAAATSHGHALATGLAGAVSASAGVGVVIEAAHLCMMMRGVEKQNSRTITSAMKGVFLEDIRTREEFLRLVHPSSY